jgi:hypothetical protein
VQDPERGASRRLRGLGGQVSETFWVNVSMCASQGRGGCSKGACKARQSSMVGVRGGRLTKAFCGLLVAEVRNPARFHCAAAASNQLRRSKLGTASKRYAFFKAGSNYMAINIKVFRGFISPSHDFDTGLPSECISASEVAGQHADLHAAETTTDAT